MRKVNQVHKALYAPIDDLITYRAMPTHSIDHLDPFLFLNHHGPQQYGPNNNGLPFGPHPHRGFETLTFILHGDITHKDSAGGKSTINAGGIQWMTAGSGLIHSEVSSEQFKQEGGMEEVIQLWLNLPSSSKMVEPKYTGLQKDEIQHLEEDNGKVTIDLISGDWNGTPGPIVPLTDIDMMSMHFKEGGKLKIEVSAERNILLYLVHGEIVVNGQSAKTHELVEFSNDGKELNIEALKNSTLIFGHGEPFNEPIVASGPFVMNSQEEIQQAFEDFQSGKMGTWNA